MKRTTLRGQDASSPAIASALEPTGRPHPLIPEQPRQHPVPSTTEVATALITKAVSERLTGLTTHPRDIAEQLHQAVDDASAEHLARPDVGGFPIEEARGHEAFSTAGYAIRRALDLSANPRETAAALRTMLDMLAHEAGA
ncbi:hypothetical protein GCM10010294_60960 [Streptomyces griseoloalbus]|uniref:hypothetical protein n=1 Tax=Streptomyces griseoloalbus TaxID=67303 RepID=UPI001875C056|nr:hypothetical protein GCM10010294_60960 [Streptomyces griseoloalbus]